MRKQSTDKLADTAGDQEKQMHHPDELRYAASHEWARLHDDGSVRVGLSDFAQDQLGDVVFVDLPNFGTEIAAGATFGEVESTKSVSEVYAPVGGTITSVNSALVEAPEAINTDPYGDGWFIVITPSAAADLGHLLDAAGYEATVA
jgi:glycine cleavage system H protein